MHRNCVDYLTGHTASYPRHFATFAKTAVSPRRASGSPAACSDNPVRRSRAQPAHSQLPQLPSHKRNEFFGAVYFFVAGAFGLAVYTNTAASGFRSHGSFNNVQDQKLSTCILTFR